MPDSLNGLITGPRVLIDGKPPPVDAADVITDGPRGQTNVQDALNSGVPLVVYEPSFLATTAAIPGVVYASDTSTYEAGLYMFDGVTVVSASGTSTDVWIGFELNGNLQPNAWTDTPKGGTLSAASKGLVFLPAGQTTFTVRLAKASGPADAEAISSALSLTRIS